MRRVFAPAKYVLILAVCTLFASHGYADSISLNISVDLSGLAASPDSEIVFVLTNGTGLGNNTATLTNFQFGGGAAGGVDSSLTSGGVSGDFTAGATLNDSAFFTNIFAAFFSAGNSLSFNLNLTTNVTSPPDQFSFLILDPNGNPIPTSDPSGFDNLMILNIDSTSPAAQSYSDLVTTAAPVPEPSGMLLLGTAVALAFGLTASWNRRGQV
jgi:hypothetical protein